MNQIEDMRARLSNRFRGNRKPLQGFNVTANNMPRSPQSSIPHSKPKYDTVGRPSGKHLPENPPLYREKPKDIFGGWL